MEKHSDDKIETIKNLLLEPQNLMISPMEMTEEEGIEYLTNYSDKVDIVQFDGSDKPNLAKRWKPINQWLEILLRINSEKYYYLHLFSDNLDWIKEEILLCISINPNLKGIFLQVDKSNRVKILSALKNLEIIQKIISDFSINVGISINLTDLFNKEEYIEEISELTKKYVNQINYHKKQSVRM